MSFFFLTAAKAFLFVIISIVSPFSIEYIITIPSSNPCREEKMYHDPVHFVGSILIVDDDPTICKLLSRILSDDGHSVDVAYNGTTAFELVKKTDYDIIVTDVKIPGEIDGLKLLQLINSYKPDIDVIVITGYGSINEAVDFMKSGALDYIVKPLNHDHLLIVIHKTLERKRLLKAAEERDYYMRISLTDALTGLYNRKYFIDALEKELHLSDRKGRNCSVMMLDIDDFKNVNDQHGHQCGDNVLKEFALRIQNACRRYDTIARYGGEEFSIMLPGTPIPDAEKVAHRIVSSVKRASYNGVKKNITASIGISSFPYHALKVDDMIRNADKALYWSKQQGKNRYSVYSEQIEASFKHFSVN